MVILCRDDDIHATGLRPVFTGTTGPVHNIIDLNQGPFDARDLNSGLRMLRDSPLNLGC